MFDVSQPATLEKVHSWVEELQGHSTGAATEDIVLTVAGNKADLRESKQSAGGEYVDSQAADRYAATISQSHNKSYAHLSRRCLDVGLDGRSHHGHLPFRLCRVGSDAKMFETSAKTGQGVEQLFQDLAQTLLARHLKQINGGDDDPMAVRSANTAKLDGKGNASGGGGCC